VPCGSFNCWAFGQVKSTSMVCQVQNWILIVCCTSSARDRIIYDTNNDHTSNQPANLLGRMLNADIGKYICKDHNKDYLIFNQTSFRRSKSAKPVPEINNSAHFATVWWEQIYFFPVAAIEKDPNRAFMYDFNFFPFFVGISFKGKTTSVHFICEVLNTGWLT
jgi:hypothetical protein